MLNGLRYQLQERHNIYQYLAKDFYYSRSSASFKYKLVLIGFKFKIKTMSTSYLKNGIDL